MARFIRYAIVQNVAIAASTVVTYMLGVNPLSHLVFTVKFLNSTGTITNYSVMQALLAAVSKVEILYKGQAIVSGSLQDLMMVNYFITGGQPYGVQIIKTTAYARSVSVIIPLGRVLFSGAECFPKTNKGDLTLQITYAATPTGIVTGIQQVETVELPDANPANYLKFTTSGLTPTATGWNDVDIPIGNRILGIAMWGNTVPAAGSYNATIGQMKILVDNSEFGYTFANWESVHGEILQRRPHLWLNEHIHRGNFTTTVEGDTGTQEEVDTLLANYAFLDFDPLGDTSFAIDTRGHSRVNLRFNQQPSADASRYLPIELVSVAA